MCNELCLSTTCDQDLTVYNTRLLRFSKNLPDSPFVEMLRHPHRWYIGSSQGCSCGFRHVIDPSMGFGPPEEWWEEDPEDIEATLALVRVVKGLLKSGAAVDCVNPWMGASLEAYRILEVNLMELPDEHVRFFENHHFLFTDPPSPVAS